VNGSHGIYRPGGSALNSGQVGSIRASQFIARNYTEKPLSDEEFFALCHDQVEAIVRFGENAIGNGTKYINIKSERELLEERMSRLGAHIRSADGAKQGAEEALTQLAAVENGVKLKEGKNLPLLFKLRDLLVSQFVYFNAIIDYIQKGGGSRGSYLVLDKKGITPSDKLSGSFTYRMDKGAFDSKIQEIVYEFGKCNIQWRDVRPMPQGNNWFENVWKDYLDGAAIK
jgi:hypothetical protein